MCAESIIMTQEVIDIILAKLDKIENDVAELKAFKNKIIGMSFALSVLFAYVFDFFKSFFQK